MINPEKYFKAFKIESAKDIDLNELKRRYRILLMKYHPDHGGGHEQAQLINAAYNYILPLVIEQQAKKREAFFRSLKKEYYYYSDGTVFDRTKNRLVRYKGRKV